MLASWEARKGLYIAHFPKAEILPVKFFVCARDEFRIPSKTPIFWFLFQFRAIETEIKVVRGRGFEPLNPYGIGS
jgi:hypothetical protein